MSIDLVKHSPVALQRYMTDMGLSADMLANLVSIAPSKIIKALSNERVFKLSQLEKIAEALYIPTVYLTTNDFFYERVTPNIIEYRNCEDISQDTYSEKALIEEFCGVRKNYISIMQSLEQEPSPFDLRLTGSDAEADANTIIEFFGFYTHKRNVKSNDDYYNSWREIVELKDILVIDKGREKNGSDGMCLYFETVPIVAIFSSGQAPSRKLFTLIHELVHLGLGESAFDGRLTESSHATERYCDSVAGYVVAPLSIIENRYNEDLDLEDNIIAIRKESKASKAAIAIQLKNLGYINQSQLTQYLEIITQRYSGGFGRSNKEITVLKYFGYNFVEKVMSAMWQDQISSNTAKSILGIRDSNTPNAFKELQNKVF